MRPPQLPADLDDVVARALAEDVGPGDVTADLVPPGCRAEATVITREDAVLCGTAWFERVFAMLDPAVSIAWQAADGDPVAAGAELCRLAGPARPLLSGERTALNFLQSLSGTATLARRYADAVAGTGCRVLDTRKTVPGLRSAQKYAVACGGAANHRHGLFDALLIKENHIIAAGGLDQALRAARARHPGLTLEIEVESLVELDLALAGEPDIIMLDNFDLAALREAVVRTHRAPGAIRLEASGNVSLATVRAIAETGVDYISVGELTKNLRAVDLSMRFRLEA
ncbi:carboxylating nicotinate-nucleotide diphosphorylase [Thioalkalivibrio sp. XN8]|uniref:carboxylating nicotinate-nucleotide diphosphorylase n=1 Tax=Thioalkalivibrio sp. XN8 TaxID=2712863 RepID=UPI0013E9B363|nr:carboxylating nicotinate-nucleotide diphosphorylase [Thioalkalivibrio sp. XN8]NGP52307.1 carboxylating nicotinate-nucleotide diphosphorylase [Thioalkalivibrio sp. XN8]